jgi:hypothetical protein
MSLNARHFPSSFTFLFCFWSELNVFYYVLQNTSHLHLDAINFRIFTCAFYKCIVCVLCGKNSIIEHLMEMVKTFKLYSKNLGFGYKVFFLTSDF